MPRGKSKTQLLNEFAITTANALITVGYMKEVQRKTGFKATYFQILVESGRLQEAIHHINRTLLRV